MSMPGPIARLAVGILTASALVSGALAADYEAPPELSASDLLPADVVSGPAYIIDDRVRNDGYINYYTIKSDYGDFEAAGGAGLKIRLAEVAAMTALDELSNTEVFLKAAADAGMGQIKALQQFALNPVETVAGIPAGVGRMFTRFARKTSDVAKATTEFVVSEGEETEADAGTAEDADSASDGDAVEEKSDENKAMELTESYFGVSGAERAWSQKLGTDPYSTNETLRAAIKEVAWAERLGKFGMGFSGIPSIPGADLIGEVNSLVWSKDPYELADLNRARLASTGAEEELIEAYLENPWISPSRKTYLTAAIAEITDAEGREGILEQSLNPKTEAEVQFFIESVTMLSWYHLNRKPITRITSDLAIPGGITDEGNAVFVFATDHVYWTEQVATAAARFAQSGTDQAGAPGAALFLGVVSRRCESELTALGFAVRQNLSASLAEQDVPAVADP